MKSFSLPSSASPRTMWILFGMVLCAIVAGFAWLSRHALKLNRQQQVAAQRESLEQDIRIALWRLDSKLGPYLASVHDQTANQKFQEAMGNDDDFVLTRFKVYQSGASKSEPELPSVFVDIVDAGRMDGMGTGMDSPDNAEQQDRQTELLERIPVEQLLVAVRERLPEYTQWNNEFSQQQRLPFQNQSLVQSYNINSVGSADQMPEIVNRRGAVQQSQTMAYLGNNYGMTPSSEVVSISPFWIGNELLLVKARLGAMQAFDGVWLDWENLQESLRADISDLVPNVEFQPILQDGSANPARTLAALPVALASPEVQLADVIWSATHTTLLLSWLGLLVAAGITGIAMHRLISLSEHRAAFVSAVTHELRTPLTTFRLYSDMLARNMVTDPNDRTEYLQTLRREADRLTHLVDNVLRYSRLERNRSGPTIEPIHLHEWIERITPRLQQRLEAADMQLAVDCQGDGQWRTDPAAMEQVVFNLIDNAAKYAQDATDRRVHLAAKIDDHNIVLSVTDHGQGVPAALTSTIFQPFTKTAERAAETAAGVGLGLALAKKTANTLGGNLCYEQADGQGACFKLTFPVR